MTYYLNYFTLVTILDVNAQRKEKRREENLNSKRALKLQVRKFNKVCLQAVLIKNLLSKYKILRLVAIKR